VSAGLRVISVAAGVAAYVGWAIAASIATKRLGRDLSKMEDRTSPRVLLVGGAANLLVLATVLALTVLLLHRPLEALGLRGSTSDLMLALGGVAVTSGSAVAFLFAARGRQVHVVSPGRLGDVLLALAVLGAVAVQEEILFRAYLVLALEGLGTAWILALTTAIFVVIHLGTNAISGAQIASWTLGGLVLIVAYLLSGSIWVPIALHFATDAANVLVFRITGSHSVFTVAPPLGDWERTTYRVLYAALVGALLSWASGRAPPGGVRVHGDDDAPAALAPVAVAA
jgi:membrane protease YdiL (CAAX protease family)